MTFSFFHFREVLFLPIKKNVISLCVKCFNKKKKVYKLISR